METRRVIFASGHPGYKPNCWDTAPDIIEKEFTNSMNELALACKGHKEFGFVLLHDHFASDIVSSSQCFFETEAKSALTEIGIQCEGVYGVRGGGYIGILEEIQRLYPNVTERDIFPNAFQGCRDVRLSRGCSRLLLSCRLVNSMKGPYDSSTANSRFSSFAVEAD